MIWLSFPCSKTRFYNVFVELIIIDKETSFVIIDKANAEIFPKYLPIPKYF